MMKENIVCKIKQICIISILLILLGYIIYVNIPTKETPIVVDNEQELLNKIDSLELIIDSNSIKKDSIDKEIDTVYVTIIKNNHNYEENRNNILDNNVVEDYKFFSDYIDKYKSRHNSINNF